MQMQLFKKLILLKGKVLPEGTVRQWGKQKYRKIGGRWLPVSGAKDGIKKLITRAEKSFDGAITSGLPGVAIVDMLEKVYKIKGFGDLKKYVKTHSREESISMYRGLWDYVSKMGLPKPKVRYAFDRLVNTMIILRDLYAGPKTRLMVKIKEAGKTKYKYREAPTPKPTAKQLRVAREKLAGWEDMAKFPTTRQIKSMIKKDRAKLLWGKINPKKKWWVVEEKTIIPFKENAKGITVRLKQIRRVEKKTRRTAMLEIDIPYAYAREFLKKQIKTARRRNQLTGELERSAGYKRYFKIKDAGAEAA